jgi:hypothetical protein
MEPTTWEIKEVVQYGMPIFAIIEVQGDVSYVRATMLSQEGAMANLARITKQLAEAKASKKPYQSFKLKDKV